jgi:amidohydrolase
VFGLHVSTDHETGLVGFRAGCDYAGVLNFTVAITGRGGHCASPLDTVNPITCAAAAIGRLQALTDVQPALLQRGTVVSVGTIGGGMRNNIVPDEAVFSGTIRTHSKRIEAAVKRRVGRIVAEVARAQGAEAAIAFEVSYPPTWNDPRLTRRMHEALCGVLGPDRVITRANPIYFAEDFAYYQQKAPGLYAHLGVRPAGRKTVPGIHSARFNPDEEAMKTGMLAHVAFALEILG